MAKSERTETSLTKVDGVADLLKYTGEDDSLQMLNEYVIVPFVKVIQGMSDQELKDKYGEGAVVLRPGDALLAKRGDNNYFHFVPLFFSVRFTKWADRKDTSQMIVESSFDPTSIIAKKARDPERWSELYPGDEDKPDKEQKRYRYVEHLCFFGVIYGDHELAGTQCMLSYQVGDFRVGRSFASGIKMRKQKIETEDGIKNVAVPLWAQVWKMAIVQREKNGNKWWGIDPANPNCSPIILPEEFAEFQAKYTELKEAHAADRLRVDGDDSGAGEEEKEIDDSREF